MSEGLVARALAYPFGVPRGSFALVDGRPQPLATDALDGLLAYGRVGVLAFGANGSPERLATKLGTLATGAHVPVVAGELQDFDVVYSAHVSPYGAIPAALQRCPGAVADVHVLGLTFDQLRAIHRSEPNYVFARLDDVSLRLPNRTQLHSAYVYLTRHGCLRHHGSEVGVAPLPVRGRTRPALDQAGVLAAVRDRLAPGEDLERFVHTQASQPDVAKRRTEELRRDAVPFMWERWEQV